MRSQATHEQQQAIAIQDRALVVEAGAGTGKTWVLVRRFLALLENNPDWSLDSIISVTFTEKAAREMRSRIREAIEERAAADSSNAIWQTRRRELDRLIVGTIHGLCARILRENAIAAAIDPRFAVLDEEESALLKEEAIQTTLDLLADADSPALELLSSILVTDLRQEMGNLLNRRGVVKQLFDNLPAPEEQLQRWRAGLVDMKAALRRELLTDNDLFSDALADLPTILLPADTGDKLYPQLVNAQKGIHLWHQEEAGGALELWSTINLSGGRQASWGGKEALAELKSGLKALRETAKTLVKRGYGLEIGPDDEAAATMLQRWRLLWEQLETTYADLKEQRQALDFDDLELKAVELLEQKPRQPRLQAFMARIQHLMVDEFQDSNLQQHRIVYALAHPSEPGRLFVVGDAKQSIYRFRQAQVSIFNETAAAVNRFHKNAILKLSRSFRSHDPLVLGVNALFDHLLRPLAETHNVYEAQPGPLVAHRPSPPHYRAESVPIELHLLPRKVEEQTINAPDGRSWEAKRIADRLHELKRERYPVWDKDHYRPFEYGDAAILFRATTSLPLYEAQFQAAGLPYLTVGGRGYYDRAEIQDLMALLAALYNPADDLNVATALRSPLFSLNDETLYRLRWRDLADLRVKEARPFVAALADPPPTDQHNEVAHANLVFQDLMGLVRRVDVWSLLRQALDLTGYEAAMILADNSGGQGGRRYHNVQKFLGLARDRGEADLAQFLRRLQLLKAREAREGEATAGESDGGSVKLMSIHAAKGLEFPVVTVADLGRENRHPNSARILHDPAFGLVCKQRDADGEWQKPAGFQWAEWLNEQMEQAESKRLLYVACTRAADLLILSGRVDRKNSWLLDICAAWEIETGGEEAAADSLARRDGFAIRVFRPAHLPELFKQGQQSASRSQTRAASSDEIPPLMKPLPSLQETRPQAVTELSRRLDTEQERAAPLFRVTGSNDDWQTTRVGQLVHRALADWDCLALPAAELRQKLTFFDQRWRGGPEKQAAALAQAYKLLSDFSRGQTYQQLNVAAERIAELPFTLQTAVGPLQGTIDLLWRGPAGSWHLLDWKTEWLNRKNIAEAAANHLVQMTIYSLAAEKFLGQEITTELCFLRQNSAIYTFPTHLLAQKRSELKL